MRKMEINAIKPIVMHPQVDHVSDCWKSFLDLVALPVFAAYCPTTENI